MWLYEKRLQYPINIKKPNAKAAAVIIDQLGGPDGELGAALRYLSQRYTMPYPEIQALLTDIGTEELAHVEMISAILYQLTTNLTIDEIKKQGFDKYFLTTNLTIDEIKKQGFDKYFVDHTLGIFPQGANDMPFTCAYFQSKGDPITDLTEDMAAEQKARTTYDNILALVDDEEVRKPIRFLREREIVHYQRFGEALELVKKRLNSDNYYAFNPAFSNGKCNKNK